MPTLKKILVVEDNDINRAMLREILSLEYVILEAANGQEALSVLSLHKEEISLILLDIAMPVMDGYTFLSIMKADPAYASIPVIVTTQSDSESDEVTALSHGAADFVAKPYKPQIILHRVASIIHLRETAAMVNQFQYDRLTGLYSKEFFYQRMKECLQQNPDKKYDIICSDIENFKLMNDVFGMHAGDALLCGVADLYAKLVGDRGICGRMNADQFVCLLEHCCEYTDAIFIEAGNQINTLANAKNVVVKWGIYEIRGANITVEQMCDRALLAARSIKGQYGKYFAAYDDELRSKLLREQAITDGMDSALAEEQFIIYLQPKYRIQDERLAGAEALVRWNHPEWGLQSPAEFIPLFEKNGFITKLDQFVWDKTCAIMRSWDDQGYPPLPISVNVSRADVYHADLADCLLKIVQKHRVSPSRLHLEITESAYTENPDQIIQTVGQLRELGFVIEMDDFGSGYSSLNMLNKMPLDILKLDMQFIRSETAKPTDQGILRFIMGLARWMNLQVVAEGVETKEQLERLREIGCDYAQGFYFAKPMPYEQFKTLLDSHNTALEHQPPLANRLPDQQQILLIVDEDALYRSQVRQTFQEKYQIAEVSDGNSALTFIAKHEHQISAIVLSVTLHDPDGFSVLNALQKENDIWNIPIIATGPADAQWEERALDLGADDYAARPHTPKSLWKRTLRAMHASQLQARERVLQDEASRDYLTGLLNRRGLHAATEALGKEDAPLAVYLFDLDNLKQVNDTYGHIEADRLIQQFGTLLRSYTRGTDIVARYGGDEFIVVIKRMGSEAHAIKKGEEICRAIRGLYASSPITAACSAGIVMWNAEEAFSRTILQADQALYCAKISNKGNCCLWQGEP